MSSITTRFQNLVFDQTTKFEKKIHNSMEYMISKHAPKAPTECKSLPEGPFRLKTLIGLLPELDEVRINVIEMHDEDIFKSLITDSSVSEEFIKRTKNCSIIFERLIYFLAGIDNLAKPLKSKKEAPYYLDLMLNFGEDLPLFYGTFFHHLHKDGHLKSFPDNHNNILKNLKLVDTEKKCSH